MTSINRHSTIVNIIFLIITLNHLNLWLTDPVVINLGYDPIWFGIIIVLVTQMGVITPPVGINVYVVYGVAEGAVGGVRLESIFKGIVPFLIAIIVGIVILVAFPQIILVLPNLMY